MLLGTRPEEQDVEPKVTDIMSGVFEVFVNLTQVLAGDPKHAGRLPDSCPIRRASSGNLTCLDSW